MGRSKTIKLDFSKLYGFKILEGNTKSALRSKIGGGKNQPIGMILGSKIGKGKMGSKIK